MRLTSIDCVPEGILAEILLRLPFIAVVVAKQVCKTWKQVIECNRFTRSYTATAKLVEKFCHEDHELTYEITDSSNQVLRWDPARDIDALGGITSHINGLVVALSFCDEEKEKYYVGNVFTDKWEGVPNPPNGYLTLSRTAIFDLGRGQYKLVHWESGDVMVLDTAKPEWSSAAKQGIECSTDPVVIRDSVFSVKKFEGVLMEYNAILNHFCAVNITGTDEEPLYFGRDSAKLTLVAWQGSLYLLILDDCKEPQTVEVWRISTDGRASSVSTFEMERQVDYVEIEEVESDGLLHLQGLSSEDPQMVVIVVYSIAAKCVKDVSVVNTCTTLKLTAVPVTLSDSGGVRSAAAAGVRRPGDSSREDPASRFGGIRAMIPIQTEQA